MKTILLLFSVVSFSVYSQNDYIEFQISFEDSTQQYDFLPFDTTRINILVINNSPCEYHFFPMSCSEGRNSMEFEIITSDSIYSMYVQDRISFRNVVYTQVLLPGDSLFWQVDIMDSAHIDDLYGRGYVGMPRTLSTKAYIRLKYNLQFEDASVLNIGRLKDRKDEYIDYLDGDIESSIYYASNDPEEYTSPVEPVIKSKYDIDEDMLIGILYSPMIELNYRK